MGEQRLKVGAIVPSSNTTLEPDFQRALPGNASLHTARIWLVDTTAEDLAQMNEEAETAARRVDSLARPRDPEVRCGGQCEFRQSRNRFSAAC